MTNLEIQNIDTIDENKDKIISSEELELVFALIENDELDDAEQLDVLAKSLVENQNNYTFPVFETILEKNINNLTETETQIRQLYDKFANISGLNQEFLAMGEQTNYVENLKSFGIGKTTKPNRNKIVKTIKTHKDISKITGENMSDFIELPSNTKPSALPYITMNFKILLKDYVTYFPNHKSPFIKDGLVTGVDMKNMKYNIDYFKIVLGKIKKMDEGRIDTTSGKLDLSKPYLRDAFKMHIQGKCKNKTDEQQREILGKTFKGRKAGGPSELGLLNTPKNKRDFIMDGLIEGYIMSKAQTYTNSGKTSFGQEYALLNYSKRGEYSKFVGKGSKQFDALYGQATDFYKGLSKLGITDKNISIDSVLTFYHAFDESNKKNKTFESEKRKKIQKLSSDMQNVSPLMLGYASQGTSQIRDWIDSQHKIKLKKKYNGTGRKLCKIIIKTKSKTNRNSTRD